MEIGSNTFYCVCVWIRITIKVIGFIVTFFQTQLSYLGDTNNSSFVIIILLVTAGIGIYQVHTEKNGTS